MLFKGKRKQLSNGRVFQGGLTLAQGSDISLERASLHDAPKKVNGVAIAISRALRLHGASRFANAWNGAKRFIGPLSLLEQEKQDDAEIAAGQGSLRWPSEGQQTFVKKSFRTLWTSEPSADKLPRS